MVKQDFLVEIGCEELPPKSLLALIKAFQQGLAQGLDQEQLHYEKIHSYATPRRLALLVKQLDAQQADRQINRRGPALTAAYDKAGKPTPAALGFARSCGVVIEQLTQLTNEKGSWLAYQQHQAGQATSELLPELVSQALTLLPVAKPMTWGSEQVSFVRPVHWLLMLWGEQVLAGELLGLKAANLSYGHRFHHNQAITINKPADYATILQKPGYVIADFQQRQQRIREQINQQARQLNAHAVIGPELLEEVTGLVEWPVALTGQFDAAFLQLPAEVLISSMQAHQKYFHLVDNQGKLLPYFITISNLQSTDPDQVIAGNERVIRPRLADAQFFYQKDCQTPLKQWIEQLRQVVFQTQLGSLFEKSQRLSILASAIAQELKVSTDQAKRAAELAKADLVSDMVSEFPELQGVMGYYYALNQGEAETVAQAIQQHYWPKGAGDQLPQSKVACAVALADRLDTLVGIFAIGQQPSGDKDPFGLRRAALAILRILIEQDIDLDLHHYIDLTAKTYIELTKPSQLNNEVLDFILDRLRAWYSDQGLATDAYLAVRAKRPSRPVDFNKRIQAVNRFKALADAPVLTEANKRVSKLLAKQQTNTSELLLDKNLLVEPEEINLAQQLLVKQQQIKPLCAAMDYETALVSLTQLRDPIENFFQQVMVMSDDTSLRNNRLALLNQLRCLFLEIADISLLQIS